MRPMVVYIAVASRISQKVGWLIALVMVLLPLSRSLALSPVHGNARLHRSHVISTTYLGASDQLGDDFYFTKAGTKRIGDQAYDFVAAIAENLVNPITQGAVNVTQRNLPIALALQKIQTNMDILDNVAGRTPQLTRVELFILLSSVGVSALAPFSFGNSIVEVLVPTMAAVSASVGLSAEYVGKVAVSKSKEISALAIQAAAESEILLAKAERAKAILPLCAGISTTASAFALLAPNLLNSIARSLSVQVATEIYLVFPLIAVLAATVAGLATQETRSIALRAVGIGNRRFASSRDVGRTWLSACEQIEISALRNQQKWQTFAISVLPGPLVAVIAPGDLGLKSVVCAAIAAAQAAAYIAVCEYFVASAVEAVALKARSSAVSDTYANQAQRAGAILPFTSALAGLCAAASATAVEALHLVPLVEVQALITTVFPAAASLFAAAASVAKARCEVSERFNRLRTPYIHIFGVYARVVS